MIGLPLLAPALLCLCLATPAEALVIDVTYDSSVTSLGSSGSVTTAEIENAFNAVATAYEGAITNNVTVSVGVGWGEVGGAAVPAGDISSSTNNVMGPYSYSAIQTLLSRTGATLPASNPAGSLSYYIPDAEALALGLSPNPTAGTHPCACDGFIGFDSSASFSFPGTSTVAAGTYSFTAAAEHEIDEVLGRVSGLTTFDFAGYVIAAEPLDVFRYSAPGVSSFSINGSAYASANGGTTGLGTFNSSASGGDRGDWAVPNPDTNTNAQDASAATGTVEGLSTSDEDLLGALGWNIAANPGSLFSASNEPIGADSSLQGGDPVSTPEPASLSVFMIGAGVLGFLRRKRSS
jgi:hypothetical protein